VIGVVSHDAGGAEVLSAYLNAHPVRGAKYFLKGPAVSIFQRQGLVGENYVMEGELTLDFKYLLLSMSWRDEVTNKMLLRSKKLGIESEVMLDSWFNYAQRFGCPADGWEENLPNNISVVDSIAENIVYAVGLDKYCRIKKSENYYLQTLVDKYKKVYDPGFSCSEFLYLSAPIHEARTNNLVELATTKTTQLDLLADVSNLCNKYEIILRIRLHPSEDRGNLDRYLPLLNCEFVVSDNESILDDLKSSKYVLGYSSLAIIQAAVLGKISISYQKDDLKDLFNWEEYGVYEHYGVNRANNIIEIEEILNADQSKNMCIGIG